jgi:hypothetical protein
MKIQITLNREEFEPLLIELLSKAVKRPLKPEEVKSMTLNFYPANLEGNNLIGLIETNLGD